MARNVLSAVTKEDLEALFYVRSAITSITMENRVNCLETPNA